MKENKNVPEIRFEGFTEEWGKEKFIDVFNDLQNNTLSRVNLNYKSGLAKNIHYGDILTKFGEYIEVSKEKVPYITDDAIVEKFRNSFLKDGDIVIADTAEDETVGKCVEIRDVQKSKTIAGLHTIACRPKEKKGAKFLGYYLNSPAYHNQLIPLMQGIKVTSISKSALRDTIMVFPDSINEQSQIGKYFSSIDSLITLHQEKHQKLLDLKKAMLYKLFPKEGETVPEIRFEGFTEEWGEVRLGEVLYYTQPSDYIENDFLEKGDIPVLTAGKTFILGYSNSKEKAYRNLPTILFDDFTVDTRFITFPFMVKSSATKFLNLKDENYNLKYLYYVLSNLNYSVQSHERHWISKFSKFKMPAPSLDEQQAIGQYFSKLDEIIDLNKQKIDKLKNIKSALLDKMFV